MIVRNLEKTEGLKPLATARYWFQYGGFVKRRFIYRLPLPERITRYVSRSLISVLMPGLLLPGTSLSQEGLQPEKVRQLLAFSNSKVGCHELLENGTVYIPAFPMARGNPFFNESAWENGSVTIHGETFYNLIITYDAHLDGLVLKKNEVPGELHTPILLNPGFIDSFEINGHTFIRTKKYFPDSELTGFSELIYQGSFTCLIRHSKKFLNRYSQSNPYGEYSSLNSDIFILDKEGMHRVRNRKELLDFTQANPREVSRYLRQHNIHFRKAGSNDLHQLMKYIDSPGHE